MTVQVRDAQGNALEADNATVQLDSGFDFGAGGAGVLQYAGGGAYTAVVSSTKRGTAEIIATVDGMALAETVTVEFLPGEPTSLELTHPPADTVAGVPLHPAPRVRGFDSFGNAVASGHRLAAVLSAGAFTAESVTTVESDDQGRFRFDNLVIESAAEDYTISFERLPQER